MSEKPINLFEYDLNMYLLIRLLPGLLRIMSKANIKTADMMINWRPLM